MNAYMYVTKSGKANLLDEIIELDTPVGLDRVETKIRTGPVYNEERCTFLLFYGPASPTGVTVIWYPQ